MMVRREDETLHIWLGRIDALRLMRQIVEGADCVLSESTARHRAQALDDAAFADEVAQAINGAYK